MDAERVAGAFVSEGEVLAAAEAARRAGLPLDDAHVPYPVHGLDRALGLAPSALPAACFRFAMTGLLLAFGFEYWASRYDWPMNIGGKSLSASPALVPIAFELTVLFASLGTVAAFLLLRGLRPDRRPRFARLGGLDDRFVLVLRAEPGGPGAGELERFLRDRGAERVEKEEGA